MKKVFLLMCVVGLMIGLISGCGSSDSGLTATTKEVYNSIVSSVELEPMFENDDDYLYNYYGIDASLLEEYVFVEAQDGLKVETVVLLKVNEDSEVTSLRENLENIVSQRKGAMNNYIPEEYDIACNAVIDASGNFIYLVMSENVDEIVKIIDSYLE